MSSWKELESGRWVLEEFPIIVFEKKPPDWMAPYIPHIFNAGFYQGELRAKTKFKEFMEYVNEDSSSNS